MAAVAVNTDWKGIAVAGVLIGVAVWYLSGKIGRELDKLPKTISDPNNAANRTAEAVYKGVTGSEEAPGADLWEATHNLDGSYKMSVFTPLAMVIDAVQSNN